MKSLAQRTRAKKLAQTAAQSSGQKTPGALASMPAAGPEATEYQALLALQDDDLRRLSETQSIEARNPIKRDLAEQYRPWTEGALEAGAKGDAVQDEIVVTQMIWAIDYQDFNYALAIAAHVLKHGLTLPERYSRTTGCMIAEDIATVALKTPGKIDLETLAIVHGLTEKHDMPDPARAKLMKALGIAYSAAADDFDPESDSAIAGGKPALVAAALEFFERALILGGSKIGVKKMIEKSVRDLAALGGKPASPPDGAGPDDAGPDDAGPDDTGQEAAGASPTEWR